MRVDQQRCVSPPGRASEFKLAVQLNKIKDLLYRMNNLRLTRGRQDVSKEFQKYDKALNGYLSGIGTVAR